MAIPLSAIGPYPFITITGAPVDLLQEQTEVKARSGVDGVTIRRLGMRGRVFVVRSEVDVADLATGLTALQEYKTLTSANATTMWVGGVSLSSGGVALKVLSVRGIINRKISTSVGGINSPSGAWLVAEWTLIAINIT